MPGAKPSITAKTAPKSILQRPQGARRKMSAGASSPGQGTRTNRGTPPAKHHSITGTGHNNWRRAAPDKPAPLPEAKPKRKAPSSPAKDGDAGGVAASNGDAADMEGMDDSTSTSNTGNIEEDTGGEKKTQLREGGRSPKESNRPRRGCSPWMMASSRHPRRPSKK